MPRRVSKYHCKTRSDTCRNSAPDAAANTRTKAATLENTRQATASRSNPVRYVVGRGLTPRNAKTRRAWATALRVLPPKIRGILRRKPIIKHPRKRSWPQEAAASSEARNLGRCSRIWHQIQRKTKNNAKALWPHGPEPRPRGFGTEERRKLHQQQKTLTPSQTQ